MLGKEEMQDYCSRDLLQRLAVANGSRRRVDGPSTEGDRGKPYYSHATGQGTRRYSEGTEGLLGLGLVRIGDSVRHTWKWRLRLLYGRSAL